MSKRKKFLNTIAAVVTSASLALSGCQAQSEAQTEVRYEENNSQEEELSNNRKTAEINREIVEENRRKVEENRRKAEEKQKIEDVEKLLKMCETLATEKLDTPIIEEIINVLEEENRNKDAKGYTEWTDPNGELHDAECREYQDLLNLIKDIKRFDLIKIQDTFALYGESEGGIHIDDIHDSSFYGDICRINMHKLKDYLLSKGCENYNNLMNKMGYDCYMKYKLHNDRSDSLIDPKVVQTNFMEVNFYGNDIDSVVKINEIIEKWMRCTFSADQKEEIIGATLNMLCLGGVVNNSQFATWIMNPTKSYYECNNMNLFSFLDGISPEDAESFDFYYDSQDSDGYEFEL